MREWPKDKNGRTIQIGDVLKVFHFVDARKKRNYMYKYVLGVEQHADNDYLRISHLILDIDEVYLVLAEDGLILQDYEIVQGYFCDESFEKRPRLTAEKIE